MSLSACDRQISIQYLPGRSPFLSDWELNYTSVPQYVQLQSFLCVSDCEMAKEVKTARIAGWKTPANGHLSKDANGDDKTDYSRWRLRDNDGRLTWHYLQTDEEMEKWPQTTYDKYHLGLPTVSQNAVDD